MCIFFIIEEEETSKDVLIVIKYKEKMFRYDNMITQVDHTTPLGSSHP